MTPCFHSLAANTKWSSSGCLRPQCFGDLFVPLTDGEGFWASTLRVGLYGVGPCAVVPCAVGPCGVGTSGVGPPKLGPVELPGQIDGVLGGSRCLVMPR